MEDILRRCELGAVSSDLFLKIHFKNNIRKGSPSRFYIFHFFRHAFFNDCVASQVVRSSALHLCFMIIFDLNDLARSNSC